ncbi:MAG: hypothetical protein ABIH66_03105 [bacterium]
MIGIERKLEAAMAKQEKPEQEPQRRVMARITKAEGERTKDGTVTGIELNVKLDEVLSNKNVLEIRFTYTAWYKPDLGYVSMKGIMLLESTEEESGRVAAQWAQEQKLDNELAMNIMHNINYKCGTEAVLITKLVDLPAPMVPPRVRRAVPKDMSPGAMPTQRPQ